MSAREDPANPFFAGPLLLAVDGSEDSVLAARAAADLSRRGGCELHLVHAWQTVPSTRFAPLIRAGLHREAEELLAGEAGLLERVGAVVSRPHLREGPPVDTILDLADDVGAGLVVLGSRGLGPVKRLALGSVSEGVVHHTVRPVLVMRGGLTAWPPGRMLVGDDGSEAALNAGQLAASLGADFGIRTLFLRSYPELPRADGGIKHPGAPAVDDELKREERELRERTRKIQASPDSTPEVRVAAGDPATLILETAEEPPGPERTLVAVGSRGLGPIRRVRLGSVSTKVLRAARGPVLVYPGRRVPDDPGRA